MLIWFYLLKSFSGVATIGIDAVIVASGIQNIIFSIFWCKCLEREVVIMSPTIVEATAVLAGTIVSEVVKGIFE